MKERLQKIISAHGIASRREAERMIADGRVLVNGETATVGMSADPENDIVLVDGVLVGDRPELTYIILNKPRGYVTTMHDERGRKTVESLVNCGVRVYPVGRLDLLSEGLLIMTNDGAVANRVMHPGGIIDKCYRVSVAGADDDKAAALRALTSIDDEKIEPPTVVETEKTGDRWKLEITIHEGKNRQIRRMCAAVGMEVLRLKRIRVGELKLGRVRPGEWRHMTSDEIKYLKRL